MIIPFSGAVYQSVVTKMAEQKDRLKVFDDMSDNKLTDLGTAPPHLSLEIIINSILRKELLLAAKPLPNDKMSFPFQPEISLTRI